MKRTWCGIPDGAEVGDGVDLFFRLLIFCRGCQLQSLWWFQRCWQWWWQCWWWSQPWYLYWWQWSKSALPWYIYWSGLAEPLYPYIYFQQVTLLLSSDAIGILFSCLFASTFALLMAMIQVCSAFGDLQCSVRAILGFDVKGSQFTDAVINISTSAQVCLLLLASVSACVNDSCIWHWVIKCYVSFHVAFVTPPDFKPSKWQGGPIAPVQYFPYMQVHHT